MNPGTHPLSDPGPILALTTAYWGSQVLFTANRLGLFAALGEERAGSAEEIARRLGLAPRVTDLLLKACAGLGLLVEEAGAFRPSPLARAYLVPGNPGYLGDALRYADDLYAVWARLEETLREDRPALAPAEYLGKDPDRTRHFVRGMHNRALGVGRALLGLVDLGGRKRLLDVGGGPGTYSALLAARFPGLEATVLDLPGVVALATETLAGLESGKAVRTAAGDYHTAPFPGGNDAVLISGVFHRETEAGCRSLIEKAREALVPGGLLLVSDVFTDEGGSTPPFAALFGLNMALTAEHGGVHSDAAVARWLADAGFSQVTTRPFPPPMPHRLVQGLRL